MACVVSGPRPFSTSAKANKEQGIAAATRYWARQFDCSSESLSALPVRLTGHGAALADYDGILALFRGEAATVSFPQLVALAGYEIWGGSLAHISVVTHPGFRGRGFGRSAAAHLARSALSAGLVLQYRTLESNLPSIRISESLGFVHFATSVAVRLNRS